MRFDQIEKLTRGVHFCRGVCISTSFGTLANILARAALLSALYMLSLAGLRADLTRNEQLTRDATLHNIASCETFTRARIGCPAHRGRWLCGARVDHPGLATTVLARRPKARAWRAERG